MSGAASSVASAEAWELVVPVVPARGDARGSYGARRTLVVRLTSADGHEGWGQAGWPAGAHTEGEVRRVATAHVAGAASVTPPISHEIAAAFDLAAYDLRARATGRRFAELVGDVVREEVLVYASIHNYGDGLDARAEALGGLDAAREQGFRGLKVKIGRGSVDGEIRWLEELRTRAPGFALMADANQTYGREDALRMGEALARLGFVWFEEPLSREDVEGYRWLRERLRIALAGGEDCEGADAVDAWARTGATQVVQANLARIGGPSALAEAAARARAHAPHFAVHCWNAPLLHVATLHALATMPDAAGDARWFAALETTTLPATAPLLAEPLAVGEGGTVRVPRGAGLGVRLDADYVRAHAGATLRIDAR